MKQYSFKFVHEGVPGQVDVYPGACWVQWFGGGFHLDSVGPALGYSILKARIAHSRNRRR